MRYGVPNIYRVYPNYGNYGKYGAPIRGSYLLIHYGYRWFYWVVYAAKWTPTHGDSFMMEAFHQERQILSRLTFLIETGKGFESSIRELDEELRKEDERETTATGV